MDFRLELSTAQALDIAYALNCVAVDQIGEVERKL
jgi:hypothetical protein